MKAMKRTMGTQLLSSMGVTNAQIPLPSLDYFSYWLAPQIHQQFDSWKQQAQAVLPDQVMIALFPEQSPQCLGLV